LRAFAHQTLAHGWSGRPAAHAAPPGRAAGRRAALFAELAALSTVELANNYLSGTHARENMFATLFFAVLDVPGGLLTFVNAGHGPPVVLGGGRVKSRLMPTGRVVGVNPDEAYDLGAVVLEPGDVLLAYTDGVTDARDPGGAFFTERRLLSL